MHRRLPASPIALLLIDPGSVIWGRRPPAEAAFHQQRLLRNRLRLLAVVFAALALAWIGVEAAALSGSSLWLLALLRVALAGSLLAVAAFANRMPPMTGLVLVVLVQTAFVAAMRGQLVADVPNWLRVGYSMFPFLLVAQLAILPLAALRTLLLALPVLALALMPLWSHGSAPLHSLLLDLWLLSLILALAMWASASQLGLLIELLSARWDAAHDPMTGLANRRSLFQRLDAAIARSRRSGAPLSILALDLDHFKQVNDRHGHACGDQVIRAMAAVLEAALRAADDAGRIGGEEFVAVLSDTGIDEALRVAERIRASAAMTTVDCEGEPVAFHVSIGVAELGVDENAHALLGRADEALYAAKAAGRDRVEAARPPRSAVAGPASSPARPGWP